MKTTEDEPAAAQRREKKYRDVDTNRRVETRLTLGHGRRQPVTEVELLRADRTALISQDLRNDARYAIRLAESKDTASGAILLALSKTFLDQAEQLESVLRHSPESRFKGHLASVPPGFGAAEYWRDQAVKARAMLAQLGHPEARKVMELVVRHYEQLATIPQANGKDRARST